jgi:monofunctional biosynthetic peptidoglycan transglycosylase
MTYDTMARSTKKTKKSSPVNRRKGLLGWLFKWVGRAVLVWLAAVFALVVVYTVINPPITMTIFSEGRRLGGVDRQWTAIDDISPVVARTVVAAEDANFCQHWGFDMRAIRSALDSGANRGASTISQQVAKNVFLWQDRSWTRKAMEAVITPMIELVWSKRRIIEVYLNVAEFDEGVFGVNAAAFRYFRVAPNEITAQQAALLATVLPDPKDRNAAKPGPFMRKRSAQLVDGAATIRRDGRAACFEE